MAIPDNDSKNNTVYFAKTDFRNQERTFGIKTFDRRQHMYVVGKTGTGKTALLKNLAIQDIRSGRGVGIVDPHGEFVEEVLGLIPPERVNDVVYFNPADMENPVAFNVLEVSDPQYKHLVASDLMGIFTKIWANVWSARMEYILGNCILALLDTPGSTLLGISRILVDKDYRQKVIYNVKDPVVKAFWVQEYEAYDPRFRNEAIAPIQNKVGQFLSTSLIRNIVGQSKSTINIPDIMNKNKILLMNVSKGRVGEDNSALLGAMLITKIQLAAMERVRMLEEERQDFYLYVDEFQNFATDSFASVLSEARKYRLNLIIAHQYIGQLITETSTKVRDAVFGNVGTMIVFRVGASDAEFLEKEFEPEIVIQDLVNLPNYHVYLKLMVNRVTSRPFSAVTLLPFRAEKLEETKALIIENSRKLYARSKDIVEEEINRWSGMAKEIRAAEGIFPQGDMKYEAACWVCGKSAKLNFKPDNIRPVYCDNCLKQIKSGEIQPLPSRKEIRRQGSKEYQSHLGKLGIEFGAVKEIEENKIKEEGRSFKKTPSFYPQRRFPSMKEGEVVTRDLRSRSDGKTLSLSELKKMAGERGGEQKKKKGPAIEELRQTLREVLKDDNADEKSDGSGESLNSAENLQRKESGPVHRNESENIEKGEKKKNLRPGETIKFD